MKKLFYVLIAISALSFFSCSGDDNPIGEILGTTITAKSKIVDVQTSARTNFASDAKISAIYGRNVGKEGKVDLLNIDSLTAFVYVVSSVSKGATEVYFPVPVYGAMKSPIGLDDMLSLINDASARNTLSGMLDKVSSVSFEDAALTASDDSPAAISKALNNSAGASFMSAHPNAKIDVLLVPSLSLYSGASADWVINLYTDSSSKVIWIHKEGPIEIIQ